MRRPPGLAPNDTLKSPCPSTGSASNSGSTDRCAVSPPDGLEVFVTAVSLSSGEEFSLQQSFSTADCARTAGLDYVATFTELRFPRLVRLASARESVGGFLQQSGV